MVSSSEIKRTAGSLTINPMIVERDYVLGCYLNFLAENPQVQKDWLFKGGTCLRKCYFKAYRFSEDVDFTINYALSAKELEGLLAEVNQNVQDQMGIRFDSKQPVIEMIINEYGKESYEAKTYFRGPLGFRGSPPAIRIHLSRGELIVFPPHDLPINHAYSDQKELPQNTLKVYSLEEILIEKLRAFSGQRRYAIARDIYDISFLLKEKIEVQDSINSFKKKCAVKNISVPEISINEVIHRKKEYKLNWRDNLEYLVPDNLKIPFEESWNLAIKLLSQMLNSLN